MTEPDLPEPDEGHFFLSGTPTDPDMRNPRDRCPQCGNGRRVALCRELGVPACCGGCGRYTHDREAEAQREAERLRERYEADRSEQRRRDELAARRAARLQRKQKHINKRDIVGTAA